MEVQVAHSGLRMVLASRESIRLLKGNWEVLGVYFLLGAADDPDRYRAYVGEVGKSTLVGRVKQHATQKDWWSRALLIASDEFNSAEIGWLEGRLCSEPGNRRGWFAAAARRSSRRERRSVSPPVPWRGGRIRARR